MSDQENIDEADLGIRKSIKKVTGVISKAMSGKKKNKEVSPPEWEDPNSYNFNYPHRGLALIFAVEHFDQRFKQRKAAKVDMNNMERTFRKLGFSVKKYYDLTTKKMERALEKAAKVYDHSQSDCFACIISSHGAEYQRVDLQRKDVKVVEHYIQTKDSEIRTSDILSLFQDCDTLRKKPKLFFIQACRSQERVKKLDHGQETELYRKSPEPPHPDNERDVPDDGATGEGDYLEFSTGLEYEFTPEDEKLFESLSSTPEKSDDEEELEIDEEDTKPGKDQPPVSHTIQPIPCYQDMLIMFPATSGYFAWSNEKYGGWLMRALTSIVWNYYPTTQDLLTMLTCVNNHVSLKMETNNPKEKQMHKKKSAPIIHHMLTHDVIFNEKKKLDESM